MTSLYSQIKNQPELLDYSDYPSVRQKILDNIQQAVIESVPVENDRFRLTIENVGYSGKEGFTPSDEKNAVLTGGNLQRRLTGQYVLRDKNTDEVVDKSGKVSLINVPYMTDRGEFVRRGVRYTIPKQVRIRPGVYIRRTDSGLLEANVNVRQGVGHNFKIDFDPDTTRFDYKVGNKKIPLIPMLERMGVPSEKIKEAVGEGIYRENSILKPSTHARSWFRSLENPTEKTASEENSQEEPPENPIASYFSRMELDPDTVQRTLGKPYTNVTPEVFLDAMSKISRVYRGNDTTDDRDSLAYQTVHDAGDMLSDKIRRDQNRLLRNQLWKATNMASLKRMPSGLFNKHLDHFFNLSGLPQALEEINVYDSYDQNQRVVKLGEGGIASVQQAPMEARAVQPSYAGFIDSIKGPESSRVGLDMYLAENVRRGKNDNFLYTQFLNPSTGEREWVSSHDAAVHKIGMPEYFNSDEDFVMAVVGGNKMQFVPREEVDYYIPSGDEMYSTTLNLIPMKSGIKGMRALMGAKYFGQALPLVEREAPLVGTVSRDTEGNKVPVYSRMGKFSGALFSPVDGKVEAVYKDRIKIKGSDGKIHTQPLYRNLPLARKTVIDNTPKVKAGDTVTKGQLTASSTFSDSQGNMAPGKNLRVAYMNYRGDTFEDAVVVSEDAANKLRHVALTPINIDKNPDIEHDSRKFRTLFPDLFTKSQLNKLDDRGIAKPGTVLEQGDPVITGVITKVPELSSLGRTIQIPEHKTWDKSSKGVVTDVAETDKGFKVFIRSEEPFKDADKIVIREGGKGVAARVVPTEKMPVDEEGRPVEVIFNRLTVPSRTNPSQLLEAALGKIASKTGKPYEVEGFSDESLIDLVKEELKKHNVKTNEDLYDPVSGKTIPGIFTGNMYMMKTQQTAESKSKARATDFYTFEGEPGRGSGTGSKHIGQMEYDALLGHQAPELIRDTKLIRGQRNDEFWRELKAGRTPVVPGTPMVYEKFKDMIKAAGVNYREDPEEDSIFVMTDKDVKELTGNRQLDSAKTFDRKTFRPIKGGLFDPDKSDSMGSGMRWSYFESPEPILNPVMEQPVSKLLGMTAKELGTYISGEKEYKGLRGGQAVKRMLEDIDVDREMRDAVSIIRKGPKSKIDDAVIKYKTLKSIKDRGVSPEDYVLSRVPVLPPKHRPIQKFQDMTLVADMNHLYREWFNAARDLEDVKKADVPPEIVSNARLKLYRAFKDITGLSNPMDQKLKEKQVGGILQQLFGKKTSKESMVRRKVLGSNIDMAGLAVVSPNPGLKLNEVGLPVEQAWEVYEPFIIRHLVKNNVPAVMAAKAVEKRNPQAFRALQDVVKQRPVLINRAPSLHKYSIMAMWPRLVPGHRLEVPPQIVSGLNMDFDGDSVLTSTEILLDLDELKKHLENSKINDLQWNIDDVYLNQFTNNCGYKYTESIMQDGLVQAAMIGVDVQMQDFPRIKGTEVTKSDNVTEWDVPEGVRVKAYDRDTGETGVFKVTKFSEHRDVVMYDVVLGAKKLYPETVTMSEDNSLVIYDKTSGEIVTGRPGESIGLMCPSFVNTFVDTDDPVRYLQIGKQVPAGYDMGCFLGAMIGDGWVDIKNQVRLSSDYPELRELVLKISNGLLPLKEQGRTYEYKTERYGSDRAYRISFHLTKEAAIDLRNLIGAGAENKAIPTPCLKASRAHLKGILSGLLSTDGQCSYRKVKGKKSVSKGVRYDTTSIQLKDSFVTLCRKLGIRTGVTPYVGSTSGNNSYAINLSLVDFHKFCRENKDFKLFNNERQEVLNKILNDMDGAEKQAGKLDIVPYPDFAHSTLIKLRPATEMVSEMLCGYRKKGFMPRRYAIQFVEPSKSIEVDEAFTKWLNIVQDDKVTWRQVTSVLPAGTRTCYDITVPGPYTFATSTGLVVQDTGSFTVPVSDAAVNEAINKLMPQQHLISESSGRPMYVPDQEYLEGLYYMSKDPRKQKPIRFNSVEDMKKAYRSGDINIDTPIIIS